MGASASTELLYEVTDTLKHYLFSDAILTDFYHFEDLFEMTITAGFSRYPKTS